MTGRRPAPGSLRRGALALAAATLAASCGGGGGNGLPRDALVLVVSSDLAVGRERVLVSAVDRENRPLAVDRPLRLAFFAPDGSPREEEAEARFIWAVPGVRGMWAAETVFDAPGAWSFEVRTPGGAVKGAAPLNVAAAPLTAGVGEKAPASRSKTLADGPMDSITSDPDPDPRLYEATAADAVGSGRPSVIVFATPAFCVSRTCGPALDTAKALIDRYPDVNWVHVEVYDNLDAPDLESLVPAPAAEEWGLPSEPWVFLVDEDGVVTHRFEGTVGRFELEEALAQVME